MSSSNASSWRRALCGLLAAAMAAVALTGCSLHPFRRAFKENDCNKPQPYDLASSIPPLKVPVGIDPPDTQGALSVPVYDQPAPPPRKLTAPCLDAPPLFNPSAVLVPRGTGSTPPTPTKSKRKRHFF